jgi:hypothetical protein
MNTPHDPSKNHLLARYTHHLNAALPVVDHNPRVSLLFKTLPANYPRHLEQKHPHILNLLMDLWNTPEFDQYIHELLIDTRGNRNGFSLGVVKELMFISELHNIFKNEGLRFPEDVDSLPEDMVSWKSIQVANPTPQGFLHAIEHGLLDVIVSFLDAGVPVDYRFEDGQAPLIIAATSGQLGAVRCLIEHGARVNLPGEGKYTALHWAAYYNHSQIAAVLMDAGAAINATQHGGETPLALAVTRGHLDVVKLLLERQANPNISGNNGSPLAIALLRNNTEMIALLKQFCAHAT